MIKNSHNLALLRVENAFFARIFRQKYFNNHNIGPWTAVVKLRPGWTLLKAEFRTRNVQIFNSINDTGKILRKTNSEVSETAGCKLFAVQKPASTA
jgi:hypothetical protein